MGVFGQYCSLFIVHRPVHSVCRDIILTILNTKTNIVSNSSDWLTRLFCSFSNHDTTLTGILKIALCKPKCWTAGLRKLMNRGKNESKNVYGSK